MKCKCGKTECVLIDYFVNLPLIDLLNMASNNKLVCPKYEEIITTNQLLDYLKEGDLEE